jgi:hypothetical protein
MADINDNEQPVVAKTKKKKKRKPILELTTDKNTVTVKGRAVKPLRRFAKVFGVKL